MTDRTQVAFRTLAVGLGLGVLGDGLFRAGSGLGVNLTLWVLALAAAILALVRVRHAEHPPRLSWLVAPVVLFGLLFLWRDSPTLQALNLIGLIVSLSLPLIQQHAVDLRRSRVTDLLLGGLETAGNTLLGVPRLLGVELPWGEIGPSIQAKQAIAISRGVILTLPILALFTALLVAADAGFERIVSTIFDFDLGALPSHLALTGGFTMIAGGLLWTLALRPTPAARVQTARRLTLKMTDIGVLLGSVNVLFLGFVIVQIVTLMGGADAMAAHGWTYSAYARRGFFELVTVVALCLPMLVAADALLRRRGAKDEGWFRLLAGSQLVLLAALTASAMIRMRLYQLESGLTEQRFYTVAFMGWLMLVFGWFGWTVLRGQSERFAFGGLVAGLAVIVGLSVVNPDGWIVRTNLRHAAAPGRSFDGDYALSLSRDAVPALIDGLGSLATSQRVQLEHRLIESQQSTDWRNWTWSHQAAADRLADLSPIPSTAEVVR